MPPIISNLPTKQITYTDGKAHLNLHLLPEKEKKNVINATRNLIEKNFTAPSRGLSSVEVQDFIDRYPEFLLEGVQTQEQANWLEASLIAEFRDPTVAERERFAATGELPEVKTIIKPREEQAYIQEIWMKEGLISPVPETPTFIAGKEVPVSAGVAHLLGGITDVQLAQAREEERQGIENVYIVTPQIA